jgi:hypothetical protein
MADSQIMLTPDSLREVIAHPLRLLPEEVRPEALTLWACHRHLAGLETPMPIASLLSIWLSRDGLEMADAIAACRAMLTVEAVARHKFASDLTTELAQACATAMRRSQSLAAMLQRREGVPVRQVRQVHTGSDAIGDFLARLQ